MAMGLTAQQRQTLGFIRAYMAEHGVAQNNNRRRRPIPKGEAHVG